MNGPSCNNTYSSRVRCLIKQNAVIVKKNYWFCNSIRKDGSTIQVLSSKLEKPCGVWGLVYSIELTVSSVLAVLAVLAVFDLAVLDFWAVLTVLAVISVLDFLAVLLY